MTLVSTAGGNTASRLADLEAAVAGIDWEFETADTRYLTHDIHRYSGKYIPQIARQALELLTCPGDLVLDPMVGSGTTLIEAWLSGRQAIGFDLNPLAVLIARVKTRRVDLVALDEALSDLASVAFALPSLHGGQLLMQSSPLLDAAVAAADGDVRGRDEWFNKWFQDHLRDLLILDHAVLQLADERVRDLARVSLSDILRRSSNAHSGYPNVMFDRKAGRRPEPGPGFARMLRTYAELVTKLDGISGPEPIVELRDARHTELPDESVDAIVSHPPYIGSIPYAEYGLLSLRWLGVDDKDLDRRLLGGKRQSVDVVERFYRTYADVLKEAHRVLRPGRGMFLMVGDPVVRGVVVDLAAMTRELTGSVGFVEITSTTRRGINRRANKMSHETLLFFEKPG